MKRAEYFTELADKVSPKLLEMELESVYSHIDTAATRGQYEVEIALNAQFAKNIVETLLNHGFKVIKIHGAEGFVPHLIQWYKSSDPPPKPEAPLVIVLKEGEVRKKNK